VSDNPLIQFTEEPVTAGSFVQVPPFDAIRVEHVGPAIDALCERLESGLAELEGQLAEDGDAGFGEVAGALHALTEPLYRAWGAVSHLNAVRNTDELREAHQAAQPKVVAASIRVAQSEPIHKAYVKLAEGELSGAQRRHVDQRVLDARLTGIDLEGEERERFNAIQQELSELGTSFQNHVLDATKAWSMTLTTDDEIAGLPASYLERAKAAAEAAGEDGYRVGLDVASFLPFMQHGEHRGRREEIYRAYVQRASDGDLDNGPLIERILELRAEMAALLGFADFAEMSLAQKMAPSAGEVETLLDELAERSRAAAEKDLEEMRALADRGLNGVPEGAELAHWDLRFVSERLREEKFAISDEELRPYFPFPRVLDGLFALTERLFGVSVEAADGEVPVWNDDVRFFKLSRDGDAIAGFFLDPFARPEDKRGGAWMDECVLREEAAGVVRLPIAYLNCNQTPPVGDKPSLMTFREVETLFHEYGHGLQHMLTREGLPQVSGINGVEWDAVELPSQFMENWCYDERTLKGIAHHYETDEPLPDEMFQKLKAARTFQAGTMMLRQIDFARTDLALHHGYEAGKGITAQDIRREVTARTVVFPPFEGDRFLCAFTHIFAGGYAAGYYSYKWAEVLSADAFGAFEDAGLDDEDAVQSTGRRFADTVLGEGGGRHPMEVYQDFRGRGPSTEALLRHAGLAA
jgi:oligopeptidase A